MLELDVFCFNIIFLKIHAFFVVSRDHIFLEDQATHCRNQPAFQKLLKQKSVTLTGRNLASEIEVHHELVVAKTCRFRSDDYMVDDVFFPWGEGPILGLA